MGVATGTFQYTNGSPVANGQWQFKLSQDSILVNATAVCVAPRLISGNLDTLGAMTATFAFNDVLSTAAGLSTCYQLTIKDLGGAQVWNECYVLTGTSANINLIPPAGRSGCTGIPITVTSGAGTLTGSGASPFVAVWTAATVLASAPSIQDGGAGSGVTISIPNAPASTAGADVNIQAGTAITSGELGGNVELAPGTASTPSLTQNGRAGVGRAGCVWYFSNTIFANLATPRGDPSSTNGACIFCSDAKGPQDSVSWGSVAAGTGTGALLRYDGSNWLVIG